MVPVISNFWAKATLIHKKLTIKKEMILIEVNLTLDSNELNYKIRLKVIRIELVFRSFYNFNTFLRRIERKHKRDFGVLVNYKN